MTTPKMTVHARTRCAEMGISTKVAKAIVRNAELRYNGNPGTGTMVARWTGQPDYLVIYRPDTMNVLTVTCTTQEFVERAS